MGYDIKSEFGKLAKKFRLKFKLSKKELASLSHMSPSEYGSLEKGSTNYNVEKLQKVASVYGLLYYQFGNPNCEFPEFGELPDATREIIISRQEPLKIYKERFIIEYLTIVLSQFEFGSEFLIKYLGAKINKDYDVQFQDEEISGTIDKNFSEYVVKTDRRKLTKTRGNKPYYYQLIKKIPDQAISESKEKIGI